MSKYAIIYTNQFEKDIKKSKKQGKNLDKLFSVINLLADGLALPAKYRDHNLTGNFQGFRECHIEPDWLLVYKYKNEVLELILNRITSHSELFK